MRSESLKGPSASELGDSEISFFFFSGRLTVSLVTVHLVILCFFFLVSVLGDVAAVDREGPVVVVLGVGPPPLEALTNFPPWLRQVGAEAGL